MKSDETQYLVVCRDGKAKEIDEGKADYHLLTRTVFFSYKDAEDVIQYWVDTFDKKPDTFEIVVCPFLIPNNLYPRMREKYEGR